MTVNELIDLLSDMNPTAEVRIAHQPSWPLQFRMGDVIETADDDETPIVFIGEGPTIWDAPYLPSHAVDKLGWGR